MKKTTRKKFLIVIAGYMFVGMMGLSISTSMNGADFSLNGIEVLASERTSAPPCTGERSCMWSPPCQPGEHCAHRWVCKPGGTARKCVCSYSYISEVGPSGRCDYN